jgi:hypothetical protein
MMAGLFRISFFAISIALVSCEFPLKDENFVVVPNEPIESIGIDLNDLGDTIELIRPMSIQYDIDFPQNVNYLISVTVGDTEIHSSEKEPGSIDLSPLQFNSGFYPFKFQIFTNSGTNSLADKLGYEVLLFEIDKVLWVERSPAQKINITSIQPGDGNVIISWERYPKINFENYILFKSVRSEEQRYPLWTEIFYISDRNQTSFLDPSYLGGEATYYIVSRVTTSTDGATGDQYQFNSPRAKIIDFETVNNQLKVTWNKPIFYNAFQKYWLRKTAAFATPYFESTNISDTTFTIPDLGFGRTIELELNTVPVGAHPGGGSSTAYHSTYKEVHLGKKFRVHEQAFVNTALNKVYHYYEGYLYVSEKGESNPYDSVPLTLNGTYNGYALGISENGQYLYAGAGTSLARLNPITLDIIESQPLSVPTGVTETYPYSIVVSNQNTLAVDTKKPQNGHPDGYTSSFITVLDGSSFTVTDTLQVKSNVIRLAGNDDLTYLYEWSSIQRRIFELTTTGTEVRRKDFRNTFSGFGYFNDNNFYAFSHSTRYQVELASLNLIQTTSLPVWVGNLAVDQASGHYFGMISGDYFVSYTHDTLEELQHVKCYDFAQSDVSSGYERFTMGNNYIYSSRGYMLEVNN